MHAAKPGTVGGVAIDGRDDVPLGKATFTDKLIGKTQKVSRPSMYPAASLTLLGRSLARSLRTPRCMRKAS